MHSQKNRSLVHKHPFAGDDAQDVGPLERDIVEKIASCATWLHSEFENTIL